VLATIGKDYPLHHPRPGWSEQAPDDWWRATALVVEQLKAAAEVELVGLGLSGQMHGSVFLDVEGRPIRRALLWNDARTGAEVAEIEGRVGRKDVIEITGNRASAGFQAPKLLWLRANEPEAAAKVATLLLPKDYVRYRLTGEIATDPSDASGTLLLDITTRHWSAAMLEALGIDESLLPDIVECADVSGRISVEGAAATGLREGLPVVGGGDNACAAIGAGLIRPGLGLCSLGTSGTLMVHSDRPPIDPEGGLNTFCDCVPGGYHLMGVILSAGASLAWFRDRLAAGDLDTLFQQAEGLPVGAEGLLFLPYLAGVRSPHADPRARGGWLGLTLAHDRPHLLRAVLEGVGFAFADCLLRMHQLGVTPEALTLVGGGSRSHLWRRILASQLALPLRGLEEQESAAVGAAMLAAVGVGLHADLESAVTATVRPPTFEGLPQPDQVNEYAGLHQRYRALYPALRGAGLF
jgi:xylulokinase